MKKIGSSPLGTCLSQKLFPNQAINRPYTRLCSITQLGIPVTEAPTNINCFNNREHVIPQCFGTFYPNNLVLHNCVCNECNQYFGNEIELYMGRDTVEGVFRYQYGIKPRKLPKKHNRIFLKVPEGDLKNILVIPSPSETEGEVDFIPIMQVGFFNERTNEYEYYEPNKIPNKDDLKNKGFKENTEIKTI